MLMKNKNTEVQYQNSRKSIIACDFDGTIVEHKFPKMGALMPFAKEVLRTLKEQGHTLILWTCRNNEYLDEAIQFLNEHEIEFDFINENPDWLGFTTSEKIYGDVYIDDRSIGGFIGWKNVLKILEPNIYDRVFPIKTFDSYWEHNY